MFANFLKFLPLRSVSFFHRSDVSSGRDLLLDRIKISMSSSCEEGEIVPDICVIEYVFLDPNEKPISFANLPLQWSENEVFGDLKTDFYLHGITVNGLQKIYEQVVAWKFDISCAVPAILVLTKDNRWLTLQKPRKSFESTIRTILITIYWMHFIKRSPQPAAKYVWNYLQVVFSSFEFKASKEDILCHKLLILEAMKRDKELATSKDVLNFVEMALTRTTLHQDVHTPNKNDFMVHGEVVIDEDCCDDDDKEVDSDICDAEINNGILALMEDVDSSFNVEEFMKRQQQLSPVKASIYRDAVDRSITVDRVEASVEGARTALAKLKAGDSLEDVKAVCNPYVLRQIFKWKGDLTVYLSPFLHGMRYTSFGRYFTNLEMLKEIVGRLHWYVQDGDTIVDFSCGSNDFSCLLKEGLEKVGKSCSFKNYDLFQPKNDFSFEQRDWMSVNVDELPHGSKLIMGLNPPGIKSSANNSFIKKALEFRPKLIILIALKETKRLGEIEAYNLIWKDDRVLFGKTFSLPGLIDVHDKPLEQWHSKPPLLCLWSRSDWTGRHRAIARERGHVL